MQLRNALFSLCLLACGASPEVSSVGPGQSTKQKGAPLQDSPNDDWSTETRALREHGSDTEKIIGANDLTPVVQDGANVPEQYRPYVDAYGKIAMGCTATHIGNGLVITAGHCFGAGEAEERNVRCSDRVSWGVRKDKEAYLTSQCTIVLAMRHSEQADYAIFRVDNVPPVAVPVNADARPSIDTTITIFGHPQLRPLEWSQTCALRPAGDGGWGANQFSHQCDTEPGSSGSSVITASSPTVIGIHDGGDARWNYATYLADTPLRELLNGGGGGGDGGGGGGGDRPTTLAFNDFGHNQNRLLATLGSSGERVSFQVKSSTESGYDFVVVRDADGGEWRQSGKKSRAFSRLAAPVQVRFTSDASVLSTAVDLLDITYH